MTVVDDDGDENKVVMKKDIHKAKADNEDEKIKLTWEDFACSFNSICPQFAEVEDIAEVNLEKRIDMRPYMMKNPPKLYANSGIEEVFEHFRHLDIRTLPILSEENG